MTLWTNVKIYSLNSNNDVYSNLITKDGIIIATDVKDIDKFEIKEVVDLKGNFMFPGFVDAHIHLIGYGRKLLSNNLDLNKNKNEVLENIKTYYNNSQSDKLLVEGYFNIGITKYELDQICNDSIIILRHNDYHSFTINSYLLDQLNIKSDDGIIINEEDVSKVVKVWKENTKEDLTTFAISAIKKLHEYGITSIHTDDLSYFNSYNETLEILNEVTLKYPLHIKTLIHHDIYKEYLNNYPNYKFIKDIQIKLFYDGTLSSKTALLKGLYKDSNNNGSRMTDDLKFKTILKNIRRNNHSVAIHTIGDLALEEVTDLLSQYPNTSKLKDRIVHASLADSNTIDKLSKLDIALDIQPLFIKSDLPFIQEYLNYTPLIYPFKKYNDNKIVLNSSSDAPVESPNPILSMMYLTDLPRLDIIKTYTFNPNYTINENNGIITNGSIANFTIFNKDILKISNEELSTASVYATVVSEKIVYLKE